MSATEFNLCNSAYVRNPSTRREVDDISDTRHSTYIKFRRGARVYYSLWLPRIAQPRSDTAMKQIMDNTSRAPTLRLDQPTSPFAWIKIHRRAQEIRYHKYRAALILVINL